MQLLCVSTVMRGFFTSLRLCLDTLMVCATMLVAHKPRLLVRMVAMSHGVACCAVHVLGSFKRTDDWQGDAVDGGEWSTCLIWVMWPIFCVVRLPSDEVNNATSLAPRTKLHG